MLASARRPRGSLGIDLPLISIPVPDVGQPVAGIRHGFPLVGGGVALIRDEIAMLGPPITAFGRLVPRVLQELTPIGGSLPCLHTSQPTLQFDLSLVGIGVSAVGRRLAGADAVLTLIQSPAALLRLGAVPGILAHGVTVYRSTRHSEARGRRPAYRSPFLRALHHSGRFTTYADWDRSMTAW